MIDNGNNDNFGPILDGITLPDTIILPPEVVTLLPWMSLAELKVVIAAIARLMQVGGAEPITLTEFQDLTGLSRPAVLDGIERAMKRGLLMRYEVLGYQGHTMFVYELKPRFIGKNFLPMTPIKAKQSKDDVVNDNDSTTTNLTLLSLSLSGEENFLRKTPIFSQKMPENEAKNTSDEKIFTHEPTEGEKIFIHEPPEGEIKNALFVRLRKIGIYAKTARYLLEHFPVERIEQCLELYPLAVQAGRADGPGWLVKAIGDLAWDLNIELEDLRDRLENRDRQQESNRDRQQEREAKPPDGLTLPKSVLEDLREIGWNGNVTELSKYYRDNRKLFKDWLKWAKSQPLEYAAARFLTGLRSGTRPPADRNPIQNYRRYIEGPYAEFIEH